MTPDEKEAYRRLCSEIMGTKYISEEEDNRIRKENWDAFIESNRKIKYPLDITESESMVRSHTFIFPGQPIPLQRPRFSGKHCWDSQKQAKLVIGLLMTKQLEPNEMFIGPVEVSFEFHFPTAKRIPESKKKALHNTPFIHVPDTDNCIKFYLDCANTILFKDDSCVATIHAKKIYGPHPKVVMTVTELS